MELGSLNGRCKGQIHFLVCDAVRLGSKFLLLRGTCDAGKAARRFQRRLLYQPLGLSIHEALPSRDDFRLSGNKNPQPPQSAALSTRQEASHDGDPHSVWLAETTASKFLSILLTGIEIQSNKVCRLTFEF